MEFHVLLVAAVLVFTNHAEANEALNAIEGRISEVIKIIDDYGIYLKNVQRYFIDSYQERKENATAEVNASVQAMENQFVAAQKLEKDVNKCRKSLTELNQNALDSHLERLKECEDTHLPNYAIVKSRATALLSNGMSYQSQVEKASDSCKNETGYGACVTRAMNSLNANTLIWRSRVIRMKNQEAEDTEDARREMPICLRSSDNRFERQLASGNQLVRACLAGLPRRTFE